MQLWCNALSPRYEKFPSGLKLFSRFLDFWIGKMLRLIEMKEDFFFSSQSPALFRHLKRSTMQLNIKK